MSTACTTGPAGPGARRPAPRSGPRPRSSGSGAGTRSAQTASPPAWTYRRRRSTGCRHDLNRLRHLDRRTAAPIRRYERSRPGELIHVDIKKLGRIPAGGGHKVLGRAQGRRNRRQGTGYAYLHTAIGDFSRLAYTEILTDEKGATAAAFWRRAEAWFRARGVVVERVLSDNGFCYRGKLFNEALAEHGIVHKYCRPYRPQTNGKVERFHRTLLEEWAYVRPYCRESDRTRAFAPWLHRYNHHRVHSAIGGPPASRVTNLPRQHS